MPDDSIKPGLELAGRYRLEELLGEGGMGAIWRAHHLVLDAPVAIKILTRDVADNEETVARFLREAKAAASLRSVHVVQILDYGVEEGVAFIAMELLEGETLRQRIKRKGTLSAEETAHIVADVCRAIGRAHDAGIVHRDLKPENIFLVTEDDAEIAKVLDFGVAKVSSSTLGPEATKTRTGSLLGTPYYMSPEQAQGNKEVDHRSDLWSLGVIAFECVTGKRPFSSDALGDLVLSICVRDIAVPSEYATVPTGFDAWFARAVERIPDARFQSAREMVEALRDTLGDEYRLTIGSVVDDREKLAELPAPASEPEPTIAPRGAVAAATAPAAEAGTKLDDTVLAAPSSMATQPQPEPGGRRSLVLVVGIGAMMLGLGGGAWVVWNIGVLDRRPPEIRFLPGAVPSPGVGPQYQPWDPDGGAPPPEQQVIEGVGYIGIDAGEDDAGEADASVADAEAETDEAGATEAGIEAVGDGGEELEAAAPSPEPSAAPPPEPPPPPSDPEAAEAYPSPSTGPY